MLLSTRAPYLLPSCVAVDAMCQSAQNADYQHLQELDLLWTGAILADRVLNFSISFAYTKHVLNKYQTWYIVEKMSVYFEHTTLEHVGHIGSVLFEFYWLSTL